MCVGVTVAVFWPLRSSAGSVTTECSSPAAAAAAAVAALFGFIHYASLMQTPVAIGFSARSPTLVFWSGEKQRVAATDSLPGTI